MNVEVSTKEIQKLADDMYMAGTVDFADSLIEGIKAANPNPNTVVMVSAMLELIEEAKNGCVEIDKADRGL